VLAPAAWQEALRRLQQLIAVRASGLVHGPHGVGKSFLIHRWSEQLSPKQYRLLRVSHSTLMGSDLLRQLVSLTGQKPQYRRGDNVLLLAGVWQQWAPLWPILVVEEDQDLLPRLDLGINRALMSRLGFCLRLDPWPREALQNYLDGRLAEVGIHASPYEAPAQELLLQSAQGSPRTVNALLQRSLELAATAQRRQVNRADVQAALDALPWLTRPPA
jgi:GTPase SAR1 family protein